MKTVRTIARHSFGLSLALIALICGFTLSAYAQGAKPSWTFTGSLNIPRHHHTATLLKTGKVLVAGGGTNGSDVLNSAELYDPAIGVWSVTGHLITARTGHTATLLQNGKVLVAGGRSSASVADDLTGAELYDPDTGTWSITGNLNLRRFNHTATLLQDGKVLVVGGGVNEHSPTAELYDPETGTWSVTVLNLALDNHRATLLPDGVVLVTGGWDENDRNWPTDNSPLNSAERYEPRTGLWSNTGELLTARVNHTATLLANGRVLVAGGDDGWYHTLNSAEMYDPGTGTWSGTGSLNIARNYYPATLLPTGKVLVEGGYGDFALASAELYDPSIGAWSNTANLSVARGEHTATLLPNGKVLVAGGAANGQTLDTAELYDSGINPNPIDDAQFFVRQQYLDFLGREPDSIGFQNWVNTLANCPNGGFGEFDNPDFDRVHVSAGFYLSEEFRGRGYWAYRFYQTSLGRAPLYTEFIPDMLKVGGEQSPQQEAISKQAFTDEWVNRAEFKAKYDALTNPADYVDELLHTAGVTLPNRDALVSSLQSGQKTRAQVLREIVESKTVEDRFFIEGFVSMQYFGYLRRDPDIIGYNNWVQTLRDDPSNFRHMIFGFIYSTEYRQRFGQP